MSTSTGSGPAAGRSPGARKWAAGSSVGLLFLLYFIVPIATSGAAAWRIAVALLFVALYAAAYAFVPPRVFGASRPVQLAALLAIALLTVPVLVLFGGSMAQLWIYVAIAGGMVLPFVWSVAVAVVLAGVMVWLGSLDGPVEWQYAITMIALTVWMAAFAGNIRLAQELRRTRDELAKAAVAAERERIGRDLHDILGHSLTAIAVKAGLARRLIARDPSRATDEIADVERLAREALADVRATASGIRDLSLAGELAVAGSVLRAAGITAVLPRSVDDVAPAGREVFPYVVREAVTNVVRHSGATTCTIALAPQRVSVVDDGHANPAAGCGSGLRGLAERVSAVGGQLSVGPGEHGGFVVTASVGGEPPTVPDGDQVRWIAS